MHRRTALLRPLLLSVILISACTLAAVASKRTGRASVSHAGGKRSGTIDVATQLHLWSQRFGDSSSQTGRAVAADASGNLVVAGDFQGSVDFGGGPLPSTGSRDIFIAKLDPNGSHLWSARFGDASAQTARAIAVDASGNVIVTGDLQGSVDFGGGALNSAGSEDIFVVKFDPSGTHLWSARFGDGSSQIARSIDVDASGDIVITGDFQGAVNFGAGALASAGSEDVFVAKFDANGVHLWSARFGDASSQSGRGIRVDSAANVIVTGSFQGSVDFGAGALASAGSEDVFLAKFTSAGAHAWSFGFGDASPQMATSLAIASTDDVFLTGDFLGNIDFGGGALPAAGGFTVFLARFDTNGNHIWSQPFGDPASQSAGGVAVDSADEVLLTGDFEGSIDFGGGALVSVGSSDIFLAKFDVTGSHLWSARFGDGSAQDGRGLVVDAAHRVTTVGTFQGSTDFGGGVLNSIGGTDIYVAQFGPALEVEGTVRYWNPTMSPFLVLTDMDITVTGTQLNLPGSPLSDVSDASGNFLMQFFGQTGSGAPPLGQVEMSAVRPTVILRDYPAIGGLDAVLLFQHAASLVAPPLTVDQLRAGDVNQDTSTDFTDATALAQFLAFIPGGSNQTADWVFSFVHETAMGGPLEDPGLMFDIGTAPIVNPEVVSVRAFLLGDVTGSFPSIGKPTRSSRVRLRLAELQRTNEHLTLALVGDLERESLQSLIYTLSYDGEELEYLGAETGAATAEFYMLDNPAESGLLHGVALGWKQPASESGDILELRFRMKTSDPKSTITFSRLRVNDLYVDDVPSLALGADNSRPLPKRFGLTIAPNPFNPATRIQYSIPDGSGTVGVDLRIYDINGRLVRSMAEGSKGPGWHTVNWNGTDQSSRDVAAGVYFLRVNAGSWSTVEKISLVK